MKKIILFATCVFLLFAGFNAAGEKRIDADLIKNPKSSDLNSILKGKELFFLKCSICHGEKADGNGPSADSFEVVPWSFDNGMIDDVSDGFLFQKIKNGGEWFEMPPFGLILKDDEIWDIINYLRSISNE